MRARELSPGDELEGKYRVLRFLGAGGMGAVYAARRVALDDVVAIKVLLPAVDTLEHRARFLREARVAASIRHPHVVQVFDFGGGQSEPPYIVMEYLEGATLQQEIRERGALPLDRALRIFADVCAAIEAGHRKGVVHRDLKPGNIMLARSDDGREHVKVLDFGIAKLTAGSPLARDSEEAITATGAVMGTVNYLAPEQLHGKGAEKASDVFALGTILYEMVTGVPAFARDVPAATMFAIARGEFRPPQELVPNLPEETAGAIAAALSVDPAARPSSPDDLARRAGGPRPSAPPFPVLRRSLPPDGSSAVRIASSPSLDATMPILSLQSSGVAARATSTSGTTVGTPVADGAPALTHFVGRVAERRALADELTAAMDGRGRITVVVGEPGIGKTHLVNESLSLARARGATIRRGTFFDYEGSQPPAYATFFAMLSPKGAKPTDAFSAAHRALGRRPSGVAGGASAGLDEEIESSPPTAADRWRIFQSIADAFRESSVDPTPASSRGKDGAPTPLVLVLDDLQWATPLDLELVLHLHRALADVPLWIVGTARTGAPDLERWTAALGHLRAYAEIPLGPLTSDEVREWFSVGFGDARLRPEDRRRIERATDGNPYYLYEFARHLIATGHLRREGRTWVCAPLDDVALPPNVEATVRGRVDTLSEPLRKVLETAAVIGDEFRFDTLQAATELPEEALEPLLEEAVRQRLLRDQGFSSGNDHRFSSETIRRVLYDLLSPRRRQRLHRRVVDALHVRYVQSARRIARVLCYHHHAVGDHVEALDYGLQAAEDDLLGHDVDRAAASLRRAREAAEALRLRASGAGTDEQIARLEALTGIVHSRLGRHEEARRCLETVLDAKSAAPEALRLDATLELAQVHLGTGDLSAAMETAATAIERARALGDVGRMHFARVLHAGLLSRSGKPEEAARTLRAIVDELGPDAAPTLRSSALRSLAWECTKTGAFGEGEQYGRQALELARRARDPFAEHQAVHAIAAAYAEGGDLHSALPFSLEALRLSRALCMRRREAIDLANLGELRYDLGEATEALAHFEEALSIFIEIGDRACEADCRVNVGRALLASGKNADAVRQLERGREQCDATGRVEYGALARIHLGEALLESGSRDEARALLQDARARFDALRLHLTWSADLALARAWHEDPPRALQHAERAVAQLRAQIDRLPKGASAERKKKSLAEAEALIADLRARD